MYFFKQKTAYDMLISDWSSDVCSSDLVTLVVAAAGAVLALGESLDRHALPQAGAVDKHQPASGRACRIILLQCHCSRVLPIRYRWSHRWTGLRPASRSPS